VEGQVFGRAPGHSGQLQPHPDHVHGRALPARWSDLLFHDLTLSLHAPLELGFVDSQSMRDDDKISGDIQRGKTGEPKIQCSDI